MSPHSAGPWIAEAVPPDVHDDPDMQDGSEDDVFWIVAQPIEQVIAVVKRYPTEQAEANARLLAAAADLLAALRGILEIGKRDMSNPKYDGYFESAAAAIAKAEGVQ